MPPTGARARRTGVGRGARPRRKKVTPLAQALSQRAWNLDRVERLLRSVQRRFDFFTAGTSGRGPPALFAAMRREAFDARVLVDIRANPFSRHVPQWNRPALETGASQVGLEYVSRPDLGVPVALRERLHGGQLDYADVFRWYDRRVATRGTVESLGPTLERRPVFLCTELGPDYCHRHRLALAIERARGFISFDL